MYGIVVLLMYAVIMITATLLFTKKETTAEGFLAGHHNLKMIMMALSIAATWIWAPALFVSAEKAYTNGIPGLFWFLVPNVACLFLFIPFAQRIRSEMPNGITLSGYMSQKYRSDKVKGIYLFQLGALALLSTSVQLLAGGKILSVITGLPLFPITIALAVVGFSYSQFSGIKASVVTDSIQMVFMLVASLIFVLWGTKATGGYTNIVQGLSGFTGQYGSLFNAKAFDVFLGFGLPTTIGLLSGPFGDQCFWQRAFSVEKRSISKAFGLGALLFAVVPLSMGVIGYLAAGSGLKVVDTSMVNLMFIQKIFPSWVIGPFLFMILCGLISTVDSNLCAIASLTSDVQKKYNNNVSKLAMILMLIAAICIANIPGLTVVHLFLMYGTFRASTMLPTIMTLKGFNLTGNGVFYGIVFALLIGLPIFAYGNLFNISVYKTIGSLLTVGISGIFTFLFSKWRA